MPFGRRTLSHLLVSTLMQPAMAEPAGVRIGVLRFGTVSWELDVIRHHKLDDAAGLNLIQVPLATPQAAQVALQSGAVDVIVLDWLWVARQRGEGADWSFVPFSNAVGAVVAPAGSPVQSVADLAGRRLGVAGTPLDKSWLILRAYAQKQHGLALEAKAEISFGPPPLLAEQMKAGRLDAVLTFWPFAAKAEAAGARHILAIEDAVKGLGITAPVPYIGYTFSQAWADRTSAGMTVLLAASRQARAILATDDAEWQRLQPVTGAADAAELLRLRDWYRTGIPRSWGAPERQAAAELFGVLRREGGAALVGNIETLPSGTFWPVTWQPIP